MNNIFNNVLILSDYDGTFAGKDGRVVERNIEAIEYFKARGGRFSFSTGRLPLVMNRILQGFEAIANAPAIMSNGAIIYDPSDRVCLKEIFFDGASARAHVRELISLFPELDFVVYTDLGEMITDTSPEQVEGNKWRKIRLTFKTPEDAIKCRDIVKERYSHLYNCFRSWHRLTEIVSKDATKGGAIGFVKDHLQKTKGEARKVFCIGDFENDINMLQCADYAFCPDNAIDEVKSLCSHTVCNHDDGAIADMIKIIEEQYL